MDDSSIDRGVALESLVGREDVLNRDETEQEQDKDAVDQARDIYEKVKDEVNFDDMLQGSGQGDPSRGPEQMDPSTDASSSMDSGVSDGAGAEEAAAAQEAEMVMML
jgi:hypothetical protein